MRMSKIRGKPWADRKLILRRQIFERTYYFCKLNEITVYDYVCILMDECNQTGVYNFGTTKEYLEFIKNKEEEKEE